MVIAAAVIATLLIGLVILFQMSLIAGAPFGQAAWGGRNLGALPGRLRLASAGAVILLAFLAWIILAAAQLTTTSPVPRNWLGPAIWMTTVYFAVGAAVNAISRSPVERVWAPVSAVIAVCSALIAAA